MKILKKFEKSRLSNLKDVVGGYFDTTHKDRATTSDYTTSTPSGATSTDEVIRL